MNNKTVELLNQAEEGIKDFLSSDKYKIFLKTMSKFHSYSLNNTLLILMQMPKATRVAGYKTWKNTFKRQVNKGEKSIEIIGGRPYKKEVEEVKNGKKEKKEVQGISFFPVSVFDVSQTSGEPLPELTKELSSDVKEYAKLFSAIKYTSDYSIVFESLQGGVKGYCDNQHKKIAINTGMSQSQTIKTLVHEITHSDLHSGTEKLTRQTKEVEAESCAFVVCDHFGIDTKDYSFPYLASWSSDKDVPELKESFERILKQADSLIQKIDYHLEVLQKEAEKMQDQTISLADQLDKYEKIANELNKDSNNITEEKQKQVEENQHSII